jgi:tetratricopeptide (TPR) repeat protein
MRKELPGERFALGQRAYNLSRLCFERDEFDKSMRLIDIALHFLPNLPKYNYQKAVNLMAIEKYEEALGALNKAIEKNCSAEKEMMYLFFYCRGICHKKLAENARALVDLYRCLELKPDCASAWSVRASIFLKTRDFEKALESSEAALILCPNRSDYADLKDAAKEGLLENIAA